VLVRKQVKWKRPPAAIKLDSARIIRF